MAENDIKIPQENADGTFTERVLQRTPMGATVAGQVPTWTGTEWVPRGAIFTLKNTDFTAAEGQAYAVDTSGGTKTITLPPVTGALGGRGTITLWDARGMWHVNPVVLKTGNYGTTIDPGELGGGNSSVLLNTRGMKVDVIFPPYGGFTFRLLRYDNARIPVAQLTTSGLPAEWPTGFVLGTTPFRLLEFNSINMPVYTDDAGGLINFVQSNVFKWYWTTNPANPWLAVANSTTAKLNGPWVDPAGDPVVMSSVVTPTIAFAEKNHTHTIAELSSKLLEVQVQGTDENDPTVYAVAATDLPAIIHLLEDGGTYVEIALPVTNVALGATVFIQPQDVDTFIAVTDGSTGIAWPGFTELGSAERPYKFEWDGVSWIWSSNESVAQGGILYFGSAGADSVALQQTASEAITLKKGADRASLVLKKLQASEDIVCTTPGMGFVCPDENGIPYRILIGPGGTVRSQRV